MKARLDILHLDWINSERDFHISIPVCVYLQKKYGLKVVSKNIFDGYFYLLYYRPRVLIVANGIGAEINYEIIKTAHSLGVKVVTLTSEGNFNEKQIDGYIWGWNHEKIIYQDLMNIWSDRVEKILLKRYPEYKDIVKVGGATGFDRYSLLKFKNKQDFYKENPKKKSFKKIVGIASFGVFDHVMDKKYVEEHNMVECYGNRLLSMYRNDLSSLKRIYRDLISRNPDTLFVLRFHPVTSCLEYSEFEYCMDFENVYVSSPKLRFDLPYNQNQYLVSDCISISDFWISYESTTILEGWLMNKVTAVINPSRYDFEREPNYQGSLKTQTTEELEKYLQEYFEKGGVDHFEELLPKRNEVISDVIGYSDGNNHQRVGEEVLKLINSPERQFKYFNFPYRKMLKETISYRKHKSKIYQKFRPNVAIYYRQDDKKIIDKYYKLYQSVI